MVKIPIYLDYQATTPLDPRVLDEMLPYYKEQFGNPHSRTHVFGWRTEEAVEIARKSVADAINTDKKSVIFTSGATESNNLAIQGVARFQKKFYGKNHIITVITEHKCVIEACRRLEMEGFTVTYLGVNKDGVISLEELEKAITDKTCLVSVMMVNNEIGVIQPIKEIGIICRTKGVFFHTDAAQAFGKIPIDVSDMRIDLMSISGHKIYGPQGIGALYVGRSPRVRLEPLINGGGQERGMRSGTLPVTLVVGLGAATRYALSDMDNDQRNITLCSDKLKEEMLKIPEVYLNGSEVNRYNGCLNFSFAYIEGESMIIDLCDIAVSSGSACTSASLEPSYVIQALGVGEDLAHTSVRFGIGRFTTIDEIDYTINAVKKAVDRLRSMSPLWDMVQDGVDLKSIKWVGGH